MSSLYRIIDNISPKSNRLSDNFDNVRFKEIRARENFILYFLMEHCDCLILTIDKFSALERLIIDKLRQRITLKLQQ